MLSPRDSETKRAALDKANEGRNLLLGGDYEGAIAACTEAIELAPDLLGPYQTRAAAYGHLGMEKEAEADLQHLPVQQRQINHADAPATEPGRHDVGVTTSRIKAALIDFVPLTVLFFAMAIVLGRVDANDEVVDSRYIFHFIGLAIAYYTFSEAITGTSPGKWLMGLRVVRSDAQPLGLGTVLIRNMFRIIDALPIFYLLGIITIRVSPRNQRIGDILARTQVARSSTVIHATSSSIGHEDHAEFASVSSKDSSLAPRMALAISVVALISGVSIFLSPSREGLSDAQLHFNAGVQLQQQERFEGAISEYDQAIRLDPKLAEAYTYRGNAYNLLNQYQLAIEDLDEAIRLDPQDAFAYSNRGAAYGRLNQHQLAIEDYNEAIRLDPQDAFAYSNRGAAYNRLNQYQRAIQDYDEAIRLDPQDASAYSSRGNTYNRLKKYQLAIEDYNEAIRLDPQDASTYSSRGNAYNRLKQYQPAIEDLDEAIRLDPQGNRI